MTLLRKKITNVTEYDEFMKLKLSNMVYSKCEGGKLIEIDTERNKDPELDYSHLDNWARSKGLKK